MAKQKEYFTTGEFARLFNINKQTLFYYDKIGIFSPAFTADNGYRYYSFNQIETFQVLMMLRELQVPVKDIQAHLARRSPQALIRLLDERRAEVEQKLKHLQSVRRYIDEKIRITREGLSARPGEIITEDRPEEYRITTDYTGTDEEPDILAAVTDHFRYCQSQGLTIINTIGAMIPIDGISDKGYHYSRFYTVVSPQEAQEAGLSAMPESAGRYVALYDDHGYDNVLAMCHRLLDYAKENHLKLDGSLYEDVILDDLSVNGYHNYRIKLSARICP